MREKVNQPLVNTFGWLGVNGTEIEMPVMPPRQTILLQENEKRVVIADRPVFLEAELGRNAELAFIQLRRGGEDTEVSQLRVRCAEKARFAWYRIVLGGSATYDDCSVLLEGTQSSFTADLGYQLQGNEKLDVNCQVIHTGKQTESCITASGVLSDHAFKLLRGTIDLRTGCSGAEGNETENVLLLSDTVHNQSVPVILCSEEDVVGNHGTTIGRLDEELVYYLESRGMEQEAIYALMAKARLDAVIRKLPDRKLRSELLGEEEDA